MIRWSLMSYKVRWISLSFLGIPRYFDRKSSISKASNDGRVHFGETFCYLLLCLVQSILSLSHHTRFLYFSSSDLPLRSTNSPTSCQALTHYLYRNTRRFTRKVGTALMIS